MAENRYRKIEVRMWGDEKFRALSPLMPSGQSLWLFLLTGPHTGPIPGLFRAGRAALAEELAWTQEAFDKAFTEVFTKGMAKADWSARVIWIPNAAKCNPPQSPNVIIAWANEWQLIPECSLKEEAYVVLKSTAYNAGDAFRKAFDKAFAKPSGKPLPNQEQEQEQEQEKSVCAAASAPPTSRPFIAFPLNDGNEYPITESAVEEWRVLYPAVDVSQELRNMRGWLAANKPNRKTRSGVARFVAGWLSKEQNRAPRLAEGQISAKVQPQSVRFDHHLPTNLDKDAGDLAWQAILEKLGPPRVNKHSFDTWLKPARAAGIRGKSLYVTLPTPDFGCVPEKYGALIAEVLGGELEVKFVLPEAVAC